MNESDFLLLLKRHATVRTGTERRDGEVVVNGQKFPEDVVVKGWFGVRLPVKKDKFGRVVG